MFNNQQKAKRQEARGKRQEAVSIRKVFHILLSSFFFLLSSLPVNAQCAMCRAVLQNDEGKVKAQALNDGIVYLMAFPYILVGGLGYYVYKTRLQKKK